MSAVVVKVDPEVRLVPSCPLSEATSVSAFVHHLCSCSTLSVTARRNSRDCVILHGIVRYLVLLLGIAWYCGLLLGILWYCMVSSCSIAWYQMVLHSSSIPFSIVQHKSQDRITGGPSHCNPLIPTNTRNLSYSRGF